MDKTNRILLLLTKLIKGEKINKHQIAKCQNVSERSVERDICAVRQFLSETYTCSEVLFNKAENVYYLSNWNNRKLTSTEAIALLKILIGTKALCKEEMDGIVKSIRLILNPTENKETLLAIKNEMDNYLSPVHNKAILRIIEDLNRTISAHLKIELHYIKADGSSIKRIIAPLSLIFSDFYFYLIAFIDNTDYRYPAFFRIDRISHFSVTDETYDTALYTKYNTGYMRNCLQFMYAGELLTVKIRCKNSVVETLRDRLPNNWLIKEESDYKIFSVKVFGNGFIRWALSQGDSIEILEPIELRQQIFDEVSKLLKLYK